MLELYGCLYLGIQVRNARGQLHSQTEELAPIDTGYNGEVLLPYSLFTSLLLSLWRLHAMPSVQGTTVSGEVLELIEARADIIIPRAGQTHRIIVQPFVGNTRFLIGRAFIRRFRVLFDGPAQQTCLLQ